MSRGHISNTHSSSVWTAEKHISEHEESDAFSHLVAPSVSDKHLFTSHLRNIMVTDLLRLTLWREARKHISSFVRTLPPVLRHKLVVLKRLKKHNLNSWFVKRWKHLGLRSKSAWNQQKLQFLQWPLEASFQKIKSLSQSPILMPNFTGGINGFRADFCLFM